MIEEPAVVLDYEDRDHHFVRVRADRQSACDSCNLKSGCGQQAMTKLSTGKCIELTVSNTLDVKPGDLVLLGVHEQGLLRASLMVYLLPLLLMILFSALAKAWFTSSDGVVAIIGITALMTGFGVVRFYSSRKSQDNRYHPELIGIVSRSEAS